MSYSLPNELTIEIISLVYAPLVRRLATERQLYETVQLRGTLNICLFQNALYTKSHYVSWVRNLDIRPFNWDNDIASTNDILLKRTTELSQLSTDWSLTLTWKGLRELFCFPQQKTLLQANLLQIFPQSSSTPSSSTFGSFAGQAIGRPAAVGRSPKPHHHPGPSLGDVESGYHGRAQS
ncbi:hypothetical protein C8J56DRAFT_963506 [Mycena floridula]|nr:hypothetical protein C8J56DRAFT_963506 [Mycena floridula]